MAAQRTDDHEESTDSLDTPWTYASSRQALYVLLRYRRSHGMLVRWRKRIPALR